MANIQDFTSSKALQGFEVPDRNVEAWQQEARRVGAAYHQLGDEAKQIGQTIDDHQTLDQVADITNQYAKIDGNIRQGANEAITNGKSLPQYLDEDVAPQLQQISSTATTERARAHAAAMYSSTYLGYAKEFSAQQSIIDGDKVTESAKNLTSTAEKNVLLDPSSLDAQIAVTDTGLNGLVASHASAGITPQMRADMLTNKNAGLAAAAGEGWMQPVESGSATPAQIASAKAAITDPNGSIFKYATPDKMNEWMTRIQKVDTLAGDVQAKIAAQVVPDGFAAIAAGNSGQIPQMKKLVENYPTRTPEEIEHKAELGRSLQAAIDTGTAIKGVTNMSDSDATAYKEAAEAKLKTETDPAKLKSLRDIITKVPEYITQRDKDYFDPKAGGPAAFAIHNSPSVSSAVQAFQAQPSPKTFDAYANAAEAYQERLYPNEIPRLLTNDMKASFSQAVQAVATDPNGAPQLGNFLAQQASVAGTHWTQITDELAREHVLNSDQAIAASFYGKPEAQPLAISLLRVSSMKPEERLAVGGMTEQVALKQAQQALAPLAPTMQNVIGGDQTVAGYTNALAHLLQVTPNANGDTAKSLAQKMLLDEYQFDGTLRVPTGVDMGKVKSGLANVVSTIDKRNLVLAGPSTGIPRQDDRTNQIRRIQESGQWFTNERGDGAVLYTENGRPVQEIMKGKRVDVEVKFGDIDKVQPAYVPPPAYHGR